MANDEQQIEQPTVEAVEPVAQEAPAAEAQPQQVEEKQETKEEATKKAGEWPESAKERVRKMAAQKRERDAEIARQRAYIQQLEEQVKTLKAPKREDFVDPDEYLAQKSEYDAQLAAHRVEATRAKHQVTLAEKEIEHVHSSMLEQSIAEAAQKYPDFDEVVNKSTVRLSQDALTAIRESENAGDLMYAIAKDPSIAQRLNGLSFGAINRELGRIESRLPAVPSAQPIPKPPIKPVGGAKTKSVGSSFAEYEAKRNAEAGPF